MTDEEARLLRSLLIMQEAALDTLTRNHELLLHRVAEQDALLFG